LVLIYYVILVYESIKKNELIIFTQTQISFIIFASDYLIMSTIILNIETTTKNCSISLSKDGHLIALKEINDGNYSHAKNLHPFIEMVLRDTKHQYTDLSAIAVSKGPGSYTGLRIGVSAAKGLCFATDTPLIAVDTLQILALKVNIDNAVIIPILDARRMEVYQAVFDAKHQSIENTKAVVVEDETYKHYLTKGKVTFIGDAVAKIKPIILHKNAVFIENEFPSAKEMCQLSYQKFLQKDFEDVAYFEPFYLKDFIAIKSTKRYY
jgi:tRNA threonylcarbamoyladenosine biosynthesis protein TsaB